MGRSCAVGLCVALACGPSPGPQDDAGGETEAVTTSTTPTSTAGTTPVCGDGVVDVDEPCDDANAEPDDGCDACALPPVTEVWSRVFDGPEHGHDLLRAVAFTPEGRLYVAGSQGNFDRTADLALRRLDVDGTLLWEQIFAGEAGQFDGASALAVTDDSGVIVVGEIDSGVSAGTPWARRYTASGEVVWTFMGPPLTGPNGLNGVAVVDETVFVSGYESDAAERRRPVVRRLDATTGTEMWRRVHAVDGRESSALAAARDGSSLIVVGWERVGDAAKVALVQRWDTDGELTASWTWSGPDGEEVGGGAVATAPDGTIVMMTGTYFVGFAGDGAVRWTRRDEPKYRLYAPRSLAIDDRGRSFAAGSGEIEYARLKGMLAVLGPAGAVWKHEFIGGDEILSDFWGVAVHPTGFAVVGMTCTHTTCDQWVRKYAPQ